jgi:DNA polymerase-2
MNDSFEGFIVHASTSRHKNVSRLYYVGRLRSGETFAVVEERRRPCFYVRSSELSAAENLLGRGSFSHEPAPYRTIDGESCERLFWDTVGQMQQSAELLSAEKVRTYEADIRFYDQHLMSLGIHGSLSIQGSPSSGRRVDLVFVNPDLKPSDWKPALSVLSLDIETNPRNDEIRVIGLALRAPGRPEKREMLFAGSLPSRRELTPFPDERSLLQGLCERLVTWDPDIITGWNVIEFDFKIIAARMQRLGVDFLAGRSDTPAVYLPGTNGRSGTAILPGRQVLDGMRIARAGPQRFTDYTLEAVASAILGRGKTLEQLPGESKLQAIDRLYRDDPESLCRYCLEDARLVLDILERTGLLDLTLARCLHTGISLDRAWTSIPLFEHLYIEALHRRGLVAPTLGVDPFPQTEAPGGAILDPKVGLHRNVLVFDFKSLYPSIIMTFNIDPLSFVPPVRVKALTGEEQRRLIKAPNGSCFARGGAPLPELTEQFFRRRSEAFDRGDEVASYVYKIIMNSFYGVLGARGSRFASGYLSGAITSFGQHLLGWCRDFLDTLGYPVLYGDTDSLFVLSRRPEDSAREILLQEGRELCERINSELGRYLQDTFDVHSHLVLEFEKIYFRFFLPPVRASAASGEGQGRGRAKGYAGLLVPVQQLDRCDDPREAAAQIEVVGMEAVRRDWTELARGFQVGLLQLLFRGAEQDEIRTFVARLVKRLYAGQLDERLVYVKSLRKPVSMYKRSQPPHVRAAAQLEPGEQQGLIRYLWTLEGPQPLSAVSAPIDYAHYVEKQLKPIAQSFSGTLGLSIDSLFGQDEQLELF